MNSIRFDQLDFAREAADYFKQNPCKISYATAEIEDGCLLALRMSDRAVLVMECDNVVRVWDEIIGFPVIMERERK
jgi:hypothetical protein